MAVLRDGCAMSAECGALFAALAAAQGDFPPLQRDRNVRVRMKKGGEYRYRYTTLGALQRATRPILAAHELALTQLTHRVHGAVGVVTILGHASGQWLAALTMVDVMDTDAQVQGGGYTYARRYGWAAILGVASEQDTDGPPQSDEISRHVGPSPRPAPTPAPAPTGGHHPSWKADRKRFCAAIAPLGGYETVAAYCERRGWGRPSAWAQAWRTKWLARHGDLPAGVWADMLESVEMHPDNVGENKEEG